MRRPNRVGRYNHANVTNLTWYLKKKKSNIKMLSTINRFLEKSGLATNITLRLEEKGN